jgi:hypothetical protein
MADKIQFLGQRSDVSRLLAAARFLVVSQRNLSAATSSDQR